MTREQKLPNRLRPMLATLTVAPFDDPNWLFETKWDGFRMIACIECGKVTLYSRNGKILSDSYRGVAKSLEKAKENVVLAEELVALDQRGVSHFQLLQSSCSISGCNLCGVLPLPARGHVYAGAQT